MSQKPPEPETGRKRQSRAHPEVTSAFERSVAEGHERLNRTWPGLLATGAVGGIDVGIGVFALLLVLHETGNSLAAGIAFSLGFIALTLGQSELFTENFMVPITAVAAGRDRLASVGRLWAGTAVSNLIGGWLITGVIVSAAPQLKPTAIRTATHYIDLGIGWRSFALALLGGTVITLMTWMERGSTSGFGKIVAAAGAAFLLGAGELNHVIVVALECFAALHAGAPFGYADWLGAAGWAALGNTLGGIGFVTILRLIQVGADAVSPRTPGADHDPERARTASAP